MCRLFGFRSIIKGRVHESLLNADNALQVQSNLHPDGWGIAYYILSSPHVIKSKDNAINDNLFNKISGIVSSETVLAHVRSATLGENNLLNTHPFQYGHWVFAHNGNIKNFKKYKTQIEKLINPQIKPFLLGSTDSELIFYCILSQLMQLTNLNESECSIETLSSATTSALKAILQITGDYSQIDNAGNTETYYTFIITNGTTMLAHQGGKNLYYSTYKKSCPDRDTCESFTDYCEAEGPAGKTNHLLIASEPTSSNNVWKKLNPGDIVGVDSKMKVYLKNIRP